MADPDKIAIAAHLHVLLRRKTGRVTDTEWMAVNADYAREVVRFARQRAQEDGVEELRQWADRLEQAVLASPTAPPRTPLFEAAAQAVRDRVQAGPATVSPTPSTPSPPPEPPPEAPRYVGGIR